MKLNNYFPQLAQHYPQLYIGGIETVIATIRHEIVCKSSIYKASRELKIKENTLRDVLNNVSLPSLKILKTLQKYIKKNLWDDIYNECQYIGGKTYTNKIKPPKLFTSDLSYLAGIMRDGGLSNYKYELVIAQKDRAWLRNIAQIMKRIFGVKLKITGPREKDGCFYIKFRSVALYALFHTILDYKKHIWKTPKVIMCAPRKLQKFYIRGFWEAEGSYSSGVSFCQTGNKKTSTVLKDIQQILTKLEIESWIRGPYKGVNRPIWVLYIPKRDANKFFHIFKPRHRKLKAKSTANSDRLKVA